MNNLTLGILISVAMWKTPAPQYTVGGAVWYAPGVMEAQFAYRGWDPKPYLDGVALMSPSDLGKTVWLKRPGHDWEGPFLSVDCGMRGHIWEMVTVRHEVVEVGWKTAKRWGMGPFDGGWRKDKVEVWVGGAPPRRDQADDTPVDYRSWVMATARIEAK